MLCDGVGIALICITVGMKAWHIEALEWLQGLQCGHLSSHPAPLASCEARAHHHVLAIPPGHAQEISNAGVLMLWQAQKLDVQQPWTTSAKLPVIVK